MTFLGTHGPGTRDDGLLDLMFNNAGITQGGDTELLTLHQWNAIIDVNIGRDFYRMGQRSTTFSWADDLAKDALRAIKRTGAAGVAAPSTPSVAVLAAGTWRAATHVDRISQQAEAGAGDVSLARSRFGKGS